MRLQYHAWLRDSMGCASETLVLPPHVKTVGMLIDWLPTRGERHRKSLEYIDVVLVSVNLQHAERDHPVCDDDDIILAPPIAGG